MRRSAISLLAAILSSTVLAATQPVAPVQQQSLYAPQAAPLGISSSAQRVASRGGNVHLRLDTGLFGDFGVRNAAPSGNAKRAGSEFDFPLSRDSSFEIDGYVKAVAAIAGGSGKLTGGLRLTTAKGTISWDAPSFVVRQGKAPRIDFMSERGEVLFYADALMYELVDGASTFRITTSDLRISAALASQLGQPAAADHVIGDMRVVAPLDSRVTAQAPQSCGDPNWPKEDVPGVPGAKYEADVFMTTFSGSTLGTCQSCDGPGGNSVGTFKMAPSSTLRNNVNDGSAQPTLSGDPNGTSTALYTADVPWQRKFSGPNQPYGTDQHPYLIWNTYRLDTNGTITQIGRSGIKHAFLTTNGGCAVNCGNDQILGRSCGDTYGTGNNDSSSDLGPRSEVVPATGQWGRCHSIYDPNCDGSSGDFGGYGQFVHRQVIRENDVDLTVNPGATFLLESWYVVRDDINIYNTMGSRPVTFNWTGSNWTTANGTGFLLGTALDRWFTPLASPKSIGEISAPEGHAKVAVHVTDLGTGSWRYDYVVMNLDFARAVTAGTPPNLDVLRNHGFRSFSIPRSPDANVTITAFVDADGAGSNDWTATVNPGSIDFAPSPPNDASSLDWGNMVRFSITADKPPGNGTLTLGVTEPGTPATYSVEGLSVGIEQLFSNGFED